VKKEKTGRFLLLILLLLTLTACQTQTSPFSEVDTLEGMWIEAVPETVTPAGLTVSFHNSTERDDIVYACGFCVEEQKGERWYPLFRTSMVWEGPTIALPFPTASQLEAGAPNEQAYYWKSYCGALGPGTYRLVIAVSSMEDKAEPVDYFLTAPFEITGRRSSP